MLEFRSCNAHLKYQSQIQSAPSCADEQSDIFDPCPLREFTDKVHVEIQNQLQRECEVEKEVQRISIIQEQLKGSSEAVPEIPQEYHDVLADIYGSTRSMGEPKRQFNCLHGRMVKELYEYFEVKCGGSSKDIKSACDGASASLDKSVTEYEDLEVRLNKTLIETKDIKEYMRMAYENQDGLVSKSQQGLQENQTCDNALASLRESGCLTVFQDYFSIDSNFEHLVNYCTHEGLDHQVETMVSMLKRREGPVGVLANSTGTHYQNREKEIQLAAQLEWVTLNIVQMEERYALKGVDFADVKPQRSGPLEIRLAEHKRCDSTWNGAATGCVAAGGNGDVKEVLKRDVGIILPEAPGTETPLGSDTFVIQPGKGGTQRTRSAAKVASASAEGEGAVAAADPQSKVNTRESAQGGGSGGSSGFGGLGGSGGGAPSILGSQKLGNGNRVVGGVLYADDPKPTELKKLSVDSIPTQTLASASFGSQAKVGANSDTGGRNRRSGSRGPASVGGGANRFGELESATPSGGGPNAQAAEGSALGGLADALGKFASCAGGAISGAFGKVSDGIQNALGTSSPKTANANSSKDDINVRAIEDSLQAQLRNIASGMDLGSARGNIFQNMCEHYDNYVAKNHIPRDFQGCDSLK